MLCTVLFQRLQINLNLVQQQKSESLNLSSVFVSVKKVDKCTQVVFQLCDCGYSLDVSEMS